MKSKLRILHIIGGGEFGGAEQHIVNLLTSFPKDVVEATVVCFYDSLFARKLRELNIPVVTLTQYGRFDLRLLFGLQKVMQDYQPDIIHTHGVKANFLTRLAALGKNKILITTIHSNLRYDYESSLAYLIVSFMERSTRGINTHYITVSGALQEILVNQGIDKDKTSLIYNGIHLTPFQEREKKAEHREQLLHEWSLPQDAFVFGTVARFVPVKGLHFLLKGFSQVVAHDPQDHSRYRLVLVGDGPECSSLEKLSDTLGIKDRVRLAGFRQDIPVCLHAFDAFVHSSIYEGLGYTIIEAMASEVPVAATKVGGVSEFVFPQKTGLLVEARSDEALAAAMLTLANNPALREQMVQEALEMVKDTYTIEIMAEKTIELYKWVLTASKSSKAH